MGCSDEMVTIKRKSLIENLLVDYYEVEEVRGIIPRVRVIVLSNGLAEAVILELIKQQNRKILNNVISEL